MTNDERIKSLVSLGYTEREETFLCPAALHSGYFLRREYLDFIGANKGYADDQLVKKVLGMSHCREVRTGRRTLLYDLCSRPFYAEIGETDNRNRRHRSPWVIKAKLMVLDYVLENPGPGYLATEREKVDFFTDETHLTTSLLPSKIYRSHQNKTVTVRYFVDKFPVFIPADSQISFCYIDEGATATPGFETWLNQYARILATINHCQIVYVATKERNIQLGESKFRHFQNATFFPLQATQEKLRDYFELEYLYRSSQLEKLNIDKIERLKVLRKTFSAERYEQLFKLWMSSGIDAITEHLRAAETHNPLSHCGFSTYLLRHDYDLFGYRSRRKAEPNP